MKHAVLREMVLKLPQKLFVKLDRKIAGWDECWFDEENPEEAGGPKNAALKNLTEGLVKIAREKYISLNGTW